MNKLILFFALIGLSWSANAQLTIIAQGDCGANGNNLTWVLTSDNVLTISGIGEMENYTTYYGSRPWDDYKYKTKTIIVNHGVTTIGESAFRQSFSLESVTIPNSVTKLGGGSFWACNSLTAITVPSSVATIEGSVFEACSSLTSINVDTNNPNYCSYNGALYNKLRDTLICCPAGTEGAFIIPNFAITIADKAFQNCRKLTSITVPSSVLTVGYNAFALCTSLIAINVDFDNLYYSSNEGVFYNKLQDTLICYPAGKTGSFAIPSSVIAIENYAFELCNGLTSVTIGNSVKSIGDCAFCLSGLTSVTIPDSVTSIGRIAFTFCPIQTVNYNAINCTTMDGYSTSVFIDCSRFTTLNIGNQVKTIPNNAFQSCNNLLYVTIGNSIASIGNDAFSGCRRLTSITCNAISPPILGTDVFLNVLNTIPVYIPCGTYIDYRTASGWDYFSNFIEPVDTTFYSESICQGETYSKNGFNESVSGTYTQNRQSINGCDSVVCLMLYVSKDTFQIFDTISQGDTYLQYGFNVSESGIYEQHLQNCFGCDSTVILHLTVYGVGIGQLRITNYELQVYPNPANGQLRIINYELREENIQIYDVVGRLLQSTIVNLQSEITIDISHLANGMYYLKVGNETVRFVNSNV